MVFHLSWKTGTSNICDPSNEIISKRLSTGESCRAFSSGPAVSLSGHKAQFRHNCFITRARKAGVGGEGMRETGPVYCKQSLTAGEIDNSACDFSIGESERLAAVRPSTCVQGVGWESLVPPGRPFSEMLAQWWSKLDFIYPLFQG